MTRLKFMAAVLLLGIGAAVWPSASWAAREPWGEARQKFPHSQILTEFEVEPVSGSTVSSSRPILGLRFRHPPQESTIRLYLDDVDVTSSAVVTQGNVSYVPSIDLVAGRHSARVEALDGLGSPMVVQWWFLLRSVAGVSTGSLAKL